VDKPILVIIHIEMEISHCLLAYVSKRNKNVFFFQKQRTGGQNGFYLCVWLTERREDIRKECQR
jgi:hypothetical protein